MYTDAYDEVATALSEALAARSLPTDDLGLERPPDDVAAIVASNVAFRLASEFGAAPSEVAETIAADLSTDQFQYIDRIDATGPYINFYPATTYFTTTLATVDADYGKRPSRDTSVVVEHTSANPTGPIHVGRARNPIIGDAVANLLAYAGYDVDRHYYVNDAGRQMALFTWAYETFDEADLPAPDRDTPDYDLVRYYRAGNAYLDPDDDRYPASEAAIAAAEEEIQTILQGLEDGDDAVYDRVSDVVDTVLAGMRQTLHRLPAAFDEFVKETRFMRDGSTDTVVTRLKALDESVYEEGAWQLDLSEHGIDKNLVFLRSDGTSLYATRDLAHHLWKFENYDRAVTVLGEDHGLQAQQLRTTLELLGEDTSQLEQVLYSYVNLPDGKMSTRAGTGIDLDDLLDEAVERAREEVEARVDQRRHAEFSADDIEQVARQVGIGAVRYDIVAKQPTKQLTFEWDRALDFEAQSAPYIQYAHARACGILDEATAAGVSVPDTPEAAALTEPAAKQLVRTIARFPAVVDAAAEDLEPHQVGTYIRTVADQFNSFYRSCPVLDVDGDLQAARLATVAATKHTLANGLAILGIEAPSSM